MFLQQDEVLGLFPKDYVQRGRKYYKQKKVLELDIIEQSPHKLIFESETDGSGWRVYTQKVVVKQEGQALNVSGYCSCPMDYNCKHVVAALLQYMSQQDASSPDMLQRWLQSFAESFQPKQSSIRQDDKFLAYVLKPMPYNYNIMVDVVETKAARRGGLIKGRALRFSTLTDVWYKPDCLQDSDVPIIQLLKTCTNLGQQTCVLQGDTGAIALQKMVATGRCFWLDHQTHQPLQLAKPRACHQVWQYDDEGNAQFHFSVEPEAQIVSTTPVMYVDGERGQVGVLPDVHLDSIQLIRLAQMPKIPADMVEDFSMALVKACPPEVLQPPKPVALQDIKGEQPVPHLRLMWIEDELRVARLRFAYAGHEICVFENAQRVLLQREAEILAIERDLEAEDAWVESLQGVGLYPARREQSDDMLMLYDMDDLSEQNMYWLNFMEHDMPMLQEKGWQIDVDDDFAFAEQDIDAWFVDVEEQGNGWFDVRFDVQINGEKQSLLPLLEQALHYDDVDAVPDVLFFELDDGKYAKVEKAHILPMLKTLYELYDFQADSLDSVRISRFEAAALAHLSESTQDLVWQDQQHLRDMAAKMADFTGIEAVKPPQGLQASLRPYQQQGLNWLQFLRSYDFHGILADDMGLGKTVQTLAHILLEKESGRMDKPCLIIVPTSLVSNWKREAAQFTPDLKVLALQGAERFQHFDSITAHDVVLTTYPLLRFDAEILLKHAYHLLILDEAQVIKNAKTKSAQLVRQLQARHKLCLTGTPMENHLGELWSLFDFLMPGLLGDVKMFRQVFRKPIEHEGNTLQQQRLNQRIKPFILRRSKHDVAAELPEKVEMIRSVSLGEAQAALYETIRISMEQKVRDTIASKGLARSHITILDALLKLRQVCCDPRILSLKQAKKVKESAKLELLMQMLPEMLEEGRRILLFSQFTKMLSLIEDELKLAEISYTKLTGQTKNRDVAIEKFKQGKADVFLISLKAGGVGLNLTEADTVIHYDPWWNPAAENQATDRAHRIGQDKTVFVYKLVAENSVEEKIVAMQAKKQALADAVYDEQGNPQSLPVTAEDMQALFMPLG